jgi:hypothetical protein
MGVKQGCPLSPKLFGLYVIGLQKHILETAGIDAPELGGILAPLLLYANDLILMSTSPEELQLQLDALASFCEQRQLKVNLSKTKLVYSGSNHLSSPGVVHCLTSVLLNGCKVCIESACNCTGHALLSKHLCALL